MPMHPKSPVTVFHEGKPAFFARESVIRMAANYEVSSMLHYAAKGEHDGLLTLGEEGGMGLERWDNAKLSQHWANIAEEYDDYREAGKLVFEHEDPEIVPAGFPKDILEITGKDGEKIEIERNALIERLVITATAVALGSWEDHGATDFLDHVFGEGTRGFQNMLDGELIAEWHEVRNSFYMKSAAGP
ncbi:hypothetical protein [Roseivivax sp. CAU 1761]